MRATFREERQKHIIKRINQLDLDAFITFSPANRRYVTGFTGSFGTALLGARGERVIFTDTRYTGQAAQQCPEFEIVYHKFEWSILSDEFRKRDLRRVGFEPRHVTVNWLQEAQKNIEGVEWVGTEELLEDLRMTKDSSEIEAIRRAQEITEQALETVLELVKPGMAERDLSIEFQYQVRKLGADNLPGGPIVASGWRSALPHARPSDKRLEEGDFLVLDVGAVVDGYRSDMTRTVVVGEADELQREVYRIVLEAEQAGLQRLRDGVSGVEANAVPRKLVERSKFGEHAFRYGVGHGVGLDIHERPLMSALCPDTLRAGMVVTMEPGIYIPGWGGVRIEDLVLITDGDPEVLSKTTKELLEL